VLCSAIGVRACPASSTSRNCGSRFTAGLVVRCSWFSRSRACRFQNNASSLMAVLLPLANNDNEASKCVPLAGLYDSWKSTPVFSRLKSQGSQSIPTTRLRPDGKRVCRWRVRDGRGNLLLRSRFIIRIFACSQSRDYFKMSFGISAISYLSQRRSSGNRLDRNALEGSNRKRILVSLSPSPSIQI
jgi:hypothetical protein